MNCGSIKEYWCIARSLLIIDMTRFEIRNAFRLKTGNMLFNLGMIIHFLLQNDEHKFEIKKYKIRDMIGSFLNIV